jgi:hypothetical protein
MSEAGGSSARSTSVDEDKAAAVAAAHAVGSAGASPPLDRSDGHTPECAEVDGVKGRLSELRTREGELQSTIDRLVAERDAVRAEVAATESELDALVNAPVSRGRDPFEWLPDELLMVIVLMLPLATLCSGACERVCQRWAKLMESSPVKQRIRDGRWAAYESGAIQARPLEGYGEHVWSLAVGSNGHVYAGFKDSTIQVWRGSDGAFLRTFAGHTQTVYSLAMGLDGKVYSGSHDTTIRVWSDDDGGGDHADDGARVRSRGTLVRTLEGHTGAVLALAVGIDGKIYSGSEDRTIRVWSADDGALLNTNTFVGHTSTIRTLAVGPDGSVYSGSYDATIRVWSGDTGALLRTLVGHTDTIYALAVGRVGKLFSGGHDCTIRVWSCDEGTLLQTVPAHAAGVRALAVGPDGTVYSGSYDGTLRVWRGVTKSGGTLVHAHTVNAGAIYALAVGQDGALYSGGDFGKLLVW